MMTFFQLFAQSPFVSQSPARFWKLHEKVLRAYDERDPTALIGPQPADGTHLRLTPEEEQGLFQAGHPHDPHIDEDHEQYIAAHKQYISSRESTPEGRALAFDNIEIRQGLLSSQARTQQQAGPAAQPGAGPMGDIGGQGANPQPQSGGFGQSPLPQDLAGGGVG